MNNTIPRARLIKSERLSTAIRLQELAEESGLKTATLLDHDHLGIDKNTWSAWVRGGKIRKSNLQMVADFFDVDIEYLECTQIERRKKPVVEVDERELIVRAYFELERRINSALDTYIEKAGINVQYNYPRLAEPTTETVQVIEDGYLRTYEVLDDVAKEADSVTLSTSKKSVTMPVDEYHGRFYRARGAIEEILLAPWGDEKQ